MEVKVMVRAVMVKVMAVKVGLGQVKSRLG